MTPRRILILLLTLILLRPTQIRAQGSVPRVAFVNPSGQLVVASADGAFRWIVTNPGERLHPTVGYAWSPEGGRLFFAIDGSPVSLRIGDVRAQTIIEIGAASGSLSGGTWIPDGSAVLVGQDSGLTVYPVDGSGAFPAAGAQGAALMSPFSNARPNLPQASSLSPDGRYYFFLDADGVYHSGEILTSDFTLPGANDASARNSGLWASAAPLVAYWSYVSGASAISVTDAASGQTVTLSSGLSVPVIPLAWSPAGAQLVYQTGTEYIYIADLSCLSGGCASNPLEAGTALLPASAADVQMVDDWVFFRENELVRGLHLSCTASNNCVGSALTLGTQAAPQTWLHVVGGTLVYTGYTQDARNPNDREVRVIDLACLTQTNVCHPRSLVAGAVAGLISPDEAYVVIDVAGSGLNVLHIDTLGLAFLSAPSSTLGSGLASARWN